MSAATRKRHPIYTSVVDILVNAGFTDDPARLQLDLLAADVQTFIEKARQDGFRPMRITWPNGQTAIVPVPNGFALPHPAEICRAYRRGAKVTAIWPEVV
jgi:hypothetical protein